MLLKHVELSIEWLDLEYSSDCGYDALTFYDRDGHELNKFCGRKTGVSLAYNSDKSY